MPRLFFALWPDDKTRQLIANHLDTFPMLDGRRVPVENLHITLAFPGQVSGEIAQCLQHEAANIQAQAFDMKLDSLGWWRKQRVAWLAPSFVPGELFALEIQVKKIVTGCGIKLENRSYQPHLTFMRKANKPLPEMTFPAIAWPVEHFVLVESVTDPKGARYSVKEMWGLEKVLSAED